MCLRHKNVFCRLKGKVNASISSLSFSFFFAAFVAVPLVCAEKEENRPFRAFLFSHMKSSFPSLFVALLTFEKGKYGNGTRKILFLEEICLFLLTARVT